MAELQGFIQKLARKCLNTSDVVAFEIYAENSATTYLSSILDARGRWMREMEKRSGNQSSFFVTIFGVRSHTFKMACEEGRVGVRGKFKAKFF